MEIFQKLKSLLGKGHERSVRARKNILMAVLFKGVGVLIGFAYFPITLAYLSPAKFGIFLTLTSMIDWFGQLDVGIGNGLRNRLGEAIADGEDDKARGYVSTAYFALGGLFSGFTLIFVAVSFFLPWANWLGADPSLNHEIAILAMLMFVAFSINFVSSMVYEIFYALQQVAKIDLFSLISKVAFLFIIILLVLFTEESLILFGAAKTFTFAIVPVAVGVIYFKKGFRKYRPSLKLVRRAHFDALFSLGFQFFIIKICMIIIHQTNNVLIARFVALEEVTEYEAAYKYLSVFLMLFVIMTNQYWAACIEAYRKGDLEWMQSTIKSVQKVWLGTLVICGIMVAISPIFFQLWLQDKLEIPFLLTVSVSVSVCITNWVNMFNLILNGAGKIRMQMYTWIAASLLNIPISLFLAIFMDWGTIGIVLGTVFSMIPLAILSPLQVRKILSRSDTGIWAK